MPSPDGGRGFCYGIRISRPRPPRAKAIRAMAAGLALGFARVPVGSPLGFVARYPYGPCVASPGPRSKAPPTKARGALASRANRAQLALGAVCGRSFWRSRSSSSENSSGVSRKNAQVESLPWPIFSPL